MPHAACRMPDAGCRTHRDNVIMMTISGGEAHSTNIRSLSEIPSSRSAQKHTGSDRPLIPASQIRTGEGSGQVGRGPRRGARAWRQVMPTEGGQCSGPQAWERIRALAEQLGQFCFWQAGDEDKREIGRRPHRTAPHRRSFNPNYRF
jgi:hypothetical protein